MAECSANYVSQRVFCWVSLHFNYHLTPAGRVLHGFTEINIQGHQLIIITWNNIKEVVLCGLCSAWHNSVVNGVCRLGDDNTAISKCDILVVYCCLPCPIYTLHVLQSHRNDCYCEGLV